MFFTVLFIRECVCQNKHCMCSKSCHIHMLRKICTETPYSVQRTDCVIGWMFMCVRGACQLESRLRTLFVCVCVCIRGGGGQSPLAGRFGAAPVVCVCVSVWSAQVLRYRVEATLSLFLSLSPHLSHSCLTLRTDNIQGPKPLLPSSLIFNSFIPSVHLSLLSRHHASGNFGLHYGYPQHLQQHLLLLGGGKGRRIPLLSSGEQERNLTSLTLCLSFCNAML